MIGDGAGLELPSNLVEDTEGDTVHGRERRAWLAQLPQVLDEVCARWSLRVGHPCQPGGVTSWVAPARTATGDVVVLKVGWLHDEAVHEADALRIWNGHGAVRLLDAWVGGTTNALLLERCHPGSSLAQAVPPSEQDVAVAGLLHRLWIEPPSGSPFRPLQSMCERWATEFDERLGNAQVRGEQPLDPGIARIGLDLFRRLPTTAGRSVLLCTDLHAGNVLAAGREPWLVIDPKPYVGDPTYDALQHMLNCPDRLETDPHAFVRRMAGLLGLDVDRLQQWLFARCVQESLDSPDLRAIAGQLAP